MIICHVCGSEFKPDEGFRSYHKDLNHEVDIYLTRNKTSKFIYRIIIIYYKDNNSEKYIYEFLNYKLISTQIITSYYVKDDVVILSIDDLNKYKENLIFK